MDWTAGYASDVEYTIGFYNEQSPNHLNFACLLNGVEPPCQNGVFNYFELGFGRGLTSTILAAGNPDGNFYAADFNPAHVAGASSIVADAGLKNLTLLENSFEELATGRVEELPQFDYITLHGIYTWVTAENRQHIATFIGRYLKPGGTVYLSYNAMPGWSVAIPLQRLMVEYGNAFPNRSDIQMSGAAAFIGKLEELGAGYFTANPALKQRMDNISKGNTQYLVHEYMHKHWQPLYHADVARELAQAKLEFAASADFVFAFPALYLTKERQELIATVPGASARETLKDYFLNTGFRKDVFVRGIRKMSTARQTELLGQVEVALAVPRSMVSFDLKTAVVSLSGNVEIYGAVCDALAINSSTLNELHKLPTLKHLSIATLAQVTALLAGSGQAVIFFASGKVADRKAAQRLNRTLASQVRYGDDYQTLCSPLTGSGVSANFVERLIHTLLTQTAGEINLTAFKRLAGEYLDKVGRHLIKNGVPLEGQEQQTELNQHIDTFFRDKLPVWQRLGVI